MNNRTNKGVSQRKNGKFEAYVTVKQNGIRSNNTMKLYVGVYNTAEEAAKAKEKPKATKKALRRVS